VLEEPSHAEPLRDLFRRSVHRDQHGAGAC
jgi:hypothetical protein